jgi:hypothetical protein
MPCCPHLQIKVMQSPTVRDAFVSEIVKLSPPGLKLLDLRAAQNLHKWVQRHVMMQPCWERHSACCQPCI